MTSQMLKAVRMYMNRESGGGDFVFVTSCLRGSRGDEAKAAAETALVEAMNQDYVRNDQRIADHIIAMVAADEKEPAA